MVELTRISIGGLEEIPDFKGSEEDYSFLSRVSFHALKDGRKFELRGLRSTGYESPNWTVRQGDIADRKDFLNAVNSVLVEKDWYLSQSDSSTTYFKGRQVVKGVLYSHKTNK